MCSIRTERAGVVPPSSFPGQAGERAAAGRRVAGATVCLACAGVLAVAAWLTPDASGLGTHRQLGLPACGWVHGLGIPCPTCGMTTAFAAAADGDFLASLRAQPLGLVLALATGMTAVAAGYVAATGSALGGHLVRLLDRRVGWTFLLLALASWGYRIVVHKGLLP